MVSSPIIFLYFYISISVFFYGFVLFFHYIKKYKIYLGFISIVFLSFLLSLRDITIGSDSAFYYKLVIDPNNFEQKIEPIMYMIAEVTNLLGGSSFLFFLLFHYLLIC